MEELAAKYQKMENEEDGTTAVASRTRGSNPLGPTPPKDFPFVIAQQHTPYVATQIFGLLDKKSLLKCRTVCKEWKKEVDKNTSLWSNVKPLRYHSAVTKRRVDICKLIVGSVKTKNKNPKHGAKHLTPLHIAAKRGNFEIFKLIFDSLEDGLKNPTDEGDYTPLHFAAEAGHLTIAKYILECPSVTNKNAPNKAGITPLHMAALCQRSESYQINTVSIPKNPGQATKAKKFDICKMLIENADENNPSSKLSRCTPLHLAAYSGHFSTFKLIFDWALQKQPKDSKGKTPLHEAAGEGRHDIVVYLMENLDDFAPTDDEGMTPLHYAAQGGHLEVCKTLLEKVGTINVPDHTSSAYTPLHFAAREGHIEVCKLFFQYLPDIGRQSIGDEGYSTTIEPRGDYVGLTPQDLSRCYHHFKVYKLFQDRVLPGVEDMWTRLASRDEPMPPKFDFKYQNTKFPKL